MKEEENRRQNRIKGRVEENKSERKEQICTLHSKGGMLASEGYFACHLLR
jgi:hypothetical protein